MPKLEFDVTPHLEGERLDRAVARTARNLGHDLSNSKAKELVEQGAVRVDGREAWKSSRSVCVGWQIEVDVPDAWVEASDPDQVDVSDHIIYADRWIVALNKPAGLPTHATHDPDRDHAHAAVLRWLEAQGDDPPYVGIHHRLDVETSGVLLFARHRDANKGLADAFSERDVTKTYEALVAVEDEAPADEWVVKDHLGRDRHHNRMRSVKSGGDYAETSFRVLDVSDSMARVEARPHTGRTHQIRVHLSEAGFPIMGDETYGGPTRIRLRSIDRAMLHARRLELAHPVEDRHLELEAPVPDDMVELGRSSGIDYERSDRS